MIGKLVTSLKPPAKTMKILAQIFGLALACSAVAQGTIEAIPSYSTGIAGSLSGTVGWTFQATNYLQITELGCFSYLLPTTNDAIEIGLWNDDGTLVASNQVTEAGDFLNGAYYTPITPILLTPFVTYHLGAFSTNGLVGVQVFIPDVQPGDFVRFSQPIVLRGSAQSGGAGFAYPPENNGPNGAVILAPTFLFHDSVPEPAGLSLLALAGAAFVCRKRR
jgi:hypothetical protein